MSQIPSVQISSDEAPVVEASPAPAHVPTSAEQLLPATFAELNLSEGIMKALESSGYTIPTPIQARTIPLLLAGRDVLGQAQTGTGKTAAFAIPMLERIDISKKQVQVLVLTPTRELAIQVAEAFERYAAGMPGLRAVAIYGGQDYQIQFRQLDRGVHVIVGTPGRVMDHMRRGSLKLDGLRGLVLDEADEMLNMGFAEDVEWVLTQSPADRQIALFSATMPDQIRRIAQQHLREPVQITIKQKTTTADTIRQRFVIAAPHQKEAALARILEAEPIDGVLIFVKMKSTTEPLADFLNSCGHRAGALSGDVAQKQRERIVANLKAGKLDIVVATDVAARGLDVQRVSHVINYDLPFDDEAYVHRIGRTGRAGRSGEAILFVHPRERHLLKRLERATRQPIEPMDLPSNDAINEQRVSKYYEKITAALAHPDLDRFAAIVEKYRAEHDLPIEKIAAALAVLGNGDSPLLLTDNLKQHDFADSRSERPSGRDTRSFEGGDRRRSGPRTDEGMETFRIEVGRVNQVNPGNIVGAIINETGLEMSNIGRIEIFDDFSTVDLPEGMPKEIFNALKKVWVMGRKLNITRIEAPRFQEGGRRFDRDRVVNKPRRDKFIAKP
ncbi:MAG: deaD [Planctomycetaceae bacterium]|nr:deaD [Planctomycetaceae bacterium]